MLTFGFIWISSQHTPNLVYLDDELGLSRLLIPTDKHTHTLSLFASLSLALSISLSNDPSFYLHMNTPVRFMQRCSTRSNLVHQVT